MIILSLYIQTALTQGTRLASVRYTSSIRHGENECMEDDSRDVPPEMNMKFYRLRSMT